MLGSAPTVAIKEYPLPLQAGPFVLAMAAQRHIVGILKKDGANVLLSQERVGYSQEDFDFELVESGSPIKLSNTFMAQTSYIASLESNGKLLHLFGVATAQSQGGAL